MGTRSQAFGRRPNVLCSQLEQYMLFFHSLSGPAAGNGCGKCRPAKSRQGCSFVASGTKMGVQSKPVHVQSLGIFNTPVDVALRRDPSSSADGNSRLVCSFDARLKSTFGCRARALHPRRVHSMKTCATTRNHHTASSRAIQADPSRYEPRDFHNLLPLRSLERRRG